MENLKLNQPQQTKWKTNALVFLIPLATLYLGVVAANVLPQGHIVSLYDFNPVNAAFIGGVIVYLQSILIDYGKKLKSS